MGGVKLSHRERVLRALNHEEADRIPIDFGGVSNFTTIHVDGHEQLKALLGFEGGTPTIASLVSMCVRPDLRIMRRFDVDCWGLWPRAARTPKIELHQEPDGRSWFKDDWGVTWEKPAGGYYHDPVGFPLQGAEIEDLEKYPWPDATDPGRVAGLADEAREVYENSDYAIVMNSANSTGIVALCAFLTGWEDHYYNLGSRHAFLKAMVERIEDFHIKQWDAILDAAGKYIHVAIMSDDLAGQDGPTMKPSVYQELFKPSHKRICEFIKSKAPHVKVMNHACGDEGYFLPDFLDIGYDIYNPVQVTCPTIVDTAKLKAEYGDKLTFWGGGVNTQQVLPFGTPAEVREEVRRRITDLKPGGGFVFATVHNVQRDVPSENVVACFDAAMEFGWYSDAPGRENGAGADSAQISYERLANIRTETGLGAL